jgi:TolB-like protein/thioredoxin-like negative regulator of GroEL
MSLLEELKRRNVFRMAVLYLVASWVILQVADVLFDALELPATWARLVLAVLILGFPVTLVFSWIYEMTPEGIKREKDIDRSQSVTPETGRKINILIVVLLVIAIATVALDRLLPESAPVPGTATVDQDTPAEVAEPAQLAAEKFTAAPDRSIAVLPFANRSAREEDAYFVDGIHDDILTQLARIGSLTVISRTSVEKFRDTSQSMKEIGATLGVKNILEGGVQRAGDRVRINVQLIDVDTDDHLWAETYDRELTTANIFDIQSEISTAIAQALRATLSPEEKAQLGSAQTGNMAALEAYFLGRQALAKRTSASLAEAEKHFKQAIALDPDYALANVGLADTYVLQAIYSGRSRREQEALAKPLITRALAINDRLGEAYISMASMTDDIDPGTAEKLFRKGIELAPGYVTGHQWYGNSLRAQGRNTEALAQLEEAVRLDPLSGIARINLGSVLENVGRLEDARQQYEAVLQIDPGFAVAYSSLGSMDTLSGHMDDAIVQFRRAAALDPGNPQYPTLLAVIWELLGGRPESDRALGRLRAIAPSSYWSAFAGMVLGSIRGGPDAAVVDARTVHEGVPTDSLGLWILGLDDLRGGQAQQAVERYEAAYPALSSKTDPVVNAANCGVAVNLAYLLQAAGDSDRADVLLERSLKQIEGLSRLGNGGYGITDVKIYAMQGRTEQALAALRQAVDEGWILIFPWDVDLAPLHDESEYQAIMAEVEAKWVAQLEHARAMEATGELAPLPE